MTGVSLTVNDFINNFIFPGSTYPSHLTPATPASITSIECDVEFPVPPHLTCVHYGQPSEAMPDQPSFMFSSNILQSDARVVGLDRNLVGQEEEHEVTGCSASSISGHQQSESARSPYQSYSQPSCLSAAQSPLSSLV